jgi:hypothetical protein
MVCWGDYGAATKPGTGPARIKSRRACPQTEWAVERRSRTEALGSARCNGRIIVPTPFAAKGVASKRIGALARLHEENRHNYGSDRHDPATIPISLVRPLRRVPRSVSARRACARPLSYRTPLPQRTTAIADSTAKRTVNAFQAVADETHASQRNS